MAVCQSASHEHALGNLHTCVAIHTPSSSAFFVPRAPPHTGGGGGGFSGGGGGAYNGFGGGGGGSFNGGTNQTNSVDRRGDGEVVIYY